MDREAILNAVRESVTIVLPSVDPSQVQPDVQLVNLGANSMDRMEIVTMTIEALGIQVPLLKLAGTKNVGELVDRILES